MPEKQYPSEKRKSEIQTKFKDLKERYERAFERKLTDAELLEICREIEVDNKKDLVKAALKPLTESDFNFIYDEVLKKEVDDAPQMEKPKKQFRKGPLGGGTVGPGPTVGSDQSPEK